MDKLMNLWAKRDAYCEVGFYDTIIDDYCQYKGGSADNQETKGKTFNAGYEIYIYAFFLGLYSGERRPLVGDVKKFGQPVGFWGQVSQKGRTQYPQIRKYIFAACVTKTDIDYIALDKGEIKIEDAVSELCKTMNEYANQGFYLMNEKMEYVPDFFLDNQGFLNMILRYCQK